MNLKYFSQKKDKSPIIWAFYKMDFILTFLYL